MCRFKDKKVIVKVTDKEVSIHHMCRFKVQISLEMFKAFICFNTSYVSVQVTAVLFSDPAYAVSIHHMCRFKYNSYALLPTQKYVSIHHMCRFKDGFDKPIAVSDAGFNTSYVSVQVTAVLFSDPAYAVSIHHMCRFKNNNAMS